MHIYGIYAYDGTTRVDIHMTGRGTEEGPAAIYYTHTISPHRQYILIYQTQSILHPPINISAKPNHYIMFPNLPF